MNPLLRLPTFAATWFGWFYSRVPPAPWWFSSDAGFPSPNFQPYFGGSWYFFSVILNCLLPAREPIYDLHDSTTKFLSSVSVILWIWVEKCSPTSVRLSPSPYPSASRFHQSSRYTFRWKCNFNFVVVFIFTFWSALADICGPRLLLFVVSPLL